MIPLRPRQGAAVAWWASARSDMPMSLLMADHGGEPMILPTL